MPHPTPATDRCATPDLDPWLDDLEAAMFSGPVDHDDEDWLDDLEERMWSAAGADEVAS